MKQVNILFCFSEEKSGQIKVSKLIIEKRGFSIKYAHMFGVENLIFIRTVNKIRI